MCLVVDERRGIVWTGHKDGKIRSWRIEKDAGGGAASGGEGDQAAAMAGAGVTTGAPATTGASTTAAAVAVPATAGVPTTGAATGPAKPGLAAVEAATAGVPITGAATDPAKPGLVTAEAATTGVPTTGATTVGPATAEAAATGVPTTGATTAGPAKPGPATAGATNEGMPTRGATTAGPAKSGPATAGATPEGVATTGAATASLAKAGPATTTASVPTMGAATAGPTPAGAATAGPATSGSGQHFKEGLSWHAHRCPVLSLVLTATGELWSGHESGVIKAWPWEIIEKSLSLTAEEKHMAALLTERSFVDLRSLVTVEGLCPLPSVSIRYLLSDNSRSRVWSGGSQSLALWDSNKKELLKVFGINDQVETQPDMSSNQDPFSEDDVNIKPVSSKKKEKLQGSEDDSKVKHVSNKKKEKSQSSEDDMKVKLVSTTKKDKSQSSGGFLQRSRNAILGAADAVRRVAAKGTLSEDYRKIAALTMSMDGVIWIGCTNGSLIQWDGNGNRLQEFQHRSSAVQCICSFGARIWVGYASGHIQILDLEGFLLGGWVAHSNPILRMAIGGTYIFTLSNHGGIRGWYLSSPGPIDSVLRSELGNKDHSYSKREKFKVLVGTWNVGQEKATRDALVTWLAGAASDIGLVVVGLQEIEMGAGFLALSACKETIGVDGSANGQWWLDAIGKILEERASFECVGSRQLAGLLIGAWARKNLKPHIGDVEIAAVPCGLGRAIGNKGGVGIKMRVYHRVICFVNCHLAAHLEAVNKRNADFDHIYRLMAFSKIYAAGGDSALLHRGPNPTDAGKPELSEADMIVFLGDFNYRLRGISYDEARDLVSQRCFDWLREKDQLRAEMKAGKVFQGLREAQFKFPPTYKFERHKAGLSGYDAGEKKRIPAWCDRILYRDNRTIPETECSLECPVVSSVTHYDAYLDVMGSDHKPVRAILTVDVTRIDESIRRQQYGDLVVSHEKARTLLAEFFNVPETIISSDEIILTLQDASNLSITNKCSNDKATFEISCEVHSSFKDDQRSNEIPTRSPFGFPSWLKVVPASGVIKPGETVDVSLSLRQEDAPSTLEDLIDGVVSQNWWAEDTRDQEANLTIIVTGSWSTERRSHLIRVRQCSPSQLARKESNSALTKNQSRR